MFIHTSNICHQNLCPYSKFKILAPDSKFKPTYKKLFLTSLSNSTLNSLSL
ncbi:hypothetical protein HanIR_Chr05g0242601 [Helianthus annuus]|nr:hypothetical protein HanIR_Chr05g0242601 [Helianthus annuus]